MRHDAHGALHITAGIDLALLSVGVLLLAVPPVGLRPLIFVAVVPMVLAGYRVLPPRLGSLAPGVTFSDYTIFIGKVLDNAPRLPNILRLLALVDVGGLIVLLTLRLRAFHTTG